MIEETRKKSRIPKFSYSGLFFNRSIGVLYFQTIIKLYTSNQISADTTNQCKQFRKHLINIEK